MLKVIGLGPGDADFMAPAARRGIEEADVVVGYTGYIELVPEEWLSGKIVEATGMMKEVDRVRMAVEHARDGRRTTVVCSGDPGIYAMAGLVIEMLETDGLLEDIDVEVVPGIPAFGAAAALLGAPLMHDFASVSLSDLLTPWELIEKRLRMAAEADFVIAIYNPRSRRRSEHLEKALGIIAEHRNSDTPVGAVKNAGREGQHVTVSALSAVDIGAVDMRTVLIVGNSTTRLAANHMLTPRGYDRKYDLGGQ